jgi:predicted AAA+ superfamily ATPase
MVKTMAKKTKIDMPEEELMKLANEWKIAKASKSGRSARQLIDKLVKK